MFARKIRSAGAALAVAGALMVGSTLPIPASAQVTQYCVQHTRGNGEVEYIVVDDNSLKAHTAHGDAFVLFDGTCDATDFVAL